MFTSTIFEAAFGHVAPYPEDEILQEILLSLWPRCPCDVEYYLFVSQLLKNLSFMNVLNKSSLLQEFGSSRQES